MGKRFFKLSKGLRLALVALASAALWLQPLAGLAEPAAAVAPDPLQLQVFTRPGCPHCEAAKGWLAQISPRYPALRVVIADVSSDLQARHRLLALAHQRGVAALSVPAFAVGDQLLIGFDAATTPARLEALIASGGRPTTASAPQGPACSVAGPADCQAAPVPPPGVTQVVTLPWFGTLRVGELGLPLLTVAIGLVDGLNPCAMWVLLFLLSFLASLEDRKKIALIAGVFVLVSGAVYYAFMAAWLTAFALIGYSRAVQVLIGAVGLAVGAINVKDFFAFRRGLSVGIPEAAKPGLMRRMRAVVRAESLPLALAAAALLALLVNAVELLCTAGLPALYTQILAQQEVAPLQRYAYLALYNLAYVFDDAVMVAVATVTLGRAKLQERGGRWLKLISGAAMVALALLLLFKPEWLA